jgi:hypothetical protein
MTVRREIEARTGRALALGAVYATLDRLERKGLISSHDGAGLAPRAPRPSDNPTPGLIPAVLVAIVAGPLWRLLVNRAPKPAPFADA